MANFKRTILVFFRFCIPKISNIISIMLKMSKLKIFYHDMNSNIVTILL